MTFEELVQLKYDVAHDLVAWLNKEAEYPWTTVAELANEAREAFRDGNFPWERDGNRGSE